MTILWHLANPIRMQSSHQISRYVNALQFQPFRRLFWKKGGHGECILVHSGCQFTTFSQCVHKRLSHLHLCPVQYGFHSLFCPSCWQESKDNLEKLLLLVTNYLYVSFIRPVGSTPTSHRFSLVKVPNRVCIARFTSILLESFKAPGKKTRPSAWTVSAFRFEGSWS